MTPHEYHHLIATILGDLADCIEAGRRVMPWNDSNEERQIDERITIIATALRDRAQQHLTKTEAESPPLEQLWTAKEVAAHLRVTTAAVYQWIDAGKIRVCPTIGGGIRRLVRIPESSLRQFIANKADAL